MTVGSVTAFDNNFETIEYMPDERNEYLIEVEDDVQNMIVAFQRQRTINNIVNN